MQQLRARTEGTARFFVSIWAGLILWAACASEASRGSGESHFLECKTDADCVDAGSKIKCVNRECTVPSASAGDATADRRDADAPESGGIQCPSGCMVVAALPVTTCREQPYDPPLPSEWNVACACGGDAALGPVKCHRRISDGTAWVFGATGIDDPFAWTPCTPAQEEASQINCIYAGCERPPRTLCLTPSFCDAVGCGGVEYDAHGCRRLPCTADTECASDERCTLTVVQQMPCTPALGPICECPPPLPGPSASGGFCNPTSVVGQRGDWTELEVEEVQGPPPQTAAFTWYWRIGPDGGLMGSRQGLPITSALNVVDLDRLRLIADGPEFRAALRDGLPCAPPPGDVLVTFRLKFGTETIERIATGCALTGPAGNVFERLYNLVQQY
jgi:hypothetical protein